MPQLTGTHDISHLLAVELPTTIAEYDAAAARGRVQASTIEVLTADRNAWNALVQDQIATLCQVTTDRMIGGGQSNTGEMIDADELTRAPTQEETAGVLYGVPMRRKQFAIGWTQDYFDSRSPADLARTQLNAETADQRAIGNEMQRAVYVSTNYTAIDRQVDNAALDVRRFLNADGYPIPNGPTGQVFDPLTHSHYNAAPTVTGAGLGAALTALLRDVSEHGHVRNLKLIINEANAAGMLDVPGFFPYVNPLIVPGSAQDRANGAIDMEAPADNRAIGIFGTAQVWIKPWALANYYFAYAEGDPRKPLAFRVPVQPALRGLRVAAENAMFPLYARFMERRFGIGTATRTNGAVLYVGAADSIYVNPTL